jgi:hypothetical protein
VVRQYEAIHLKCFNFGVAALEMQVHVDPAEKRDDAGGL